MNICYKCRKPVEGPVVPKHGLHPDCFRGWFQLADEHEDFKDLNPRSEQPLQNTTFFHGKFKKYSASLGHKEYVLKFTDKHSELAKTEYLCNQISFYLGINTPQFHLISHSNIEDCFLSYNFMQDFKDSDLKHIYHFLKKSDLYIEDMIDAIKINTGRLKEIVNFINICLFDALIANNDRHGRNLGLIHNANGYTLSPCYDNPSYFGMVEENLLGSSFKVSCAIQTISSTKPGIKEYAEEFARLGYKSNVEDFLGKIKINEIDTLIRNSFISDKRKEALIRYVRKQEEILNNAL